MSEKYDPNKIEHIPNQNKRVNDVELARTMALEEDKGRQTGKLYKQYLREPDSFANNPDTARYIPLMHLLKEQDVSPEYLDQISEVLAEVHGGIYEFISDLERRPRGVGELERMRTELTSMVVEAKRVLDSTNVEHAVSGLPQAPEQVNAFINGIFARAKLEAVREKIAALPPYH